MMKKCLRLWLTAAIMSAMIFGNVFQVMGAETLTITDMVTQTGARSQIIATNTTNVTEMTIFELLETYELTEGQ